MSLVWFSFPIPNSTSPHCKCRKAKLGESQLGESQLGESLGTTLSFSSTKVVSLPDHQIVDHLQSWVGGSLGMRLVQIILKLKKTSGQKQGKKKLLLSHPILLWQTGLWTGNKTIFSVPSPFLC